LHEIFDLHEPLPHRQKESGRDHTRNEHGKEQNLRDFHEFD
jgi:hypothetical protein